MYVSVTVCLCLYVHVYLSLSVSVCMYTCLHLYTSVCFCFCLYLLLSVPLYLCFCGSVHICIGGSRVEGNSGHDPPPSSFAMAFAHLQRRNKPRDAEKHIKLPPYRRMSGSAIVCLRCVSDSAVNLNAYVCVVVVVQLISWL